MESITYPRDFFRRKRRIDPKLCFLLIPFRDRFKEIRKTIEPLVSDCGFELVGADDIRRPGIIHADIWDHIQRAAVVIADVSEHNPNVYFELGVAATVKDKSRLIIMRRADSQEEYPFDVRLFRYISYQGSGKEEDKLAEDLKSYLHAIRREDDDLWGILDKMSQWQDANFEYDSMLEKDELKPLKHLPWIHELNEDVLAYALVSSILHACHCGFWTKANKANMKAASPMAYVLSGAYRKPRLRAAYALQYMDENVKRECLGIVREKINAGEADDIAEDLLESVESLTVKEFTAKENDKRIDPEVAHEVLNNFKYWEVI